MATLTLTAPAAIAAPVWALVEECKSVETVFARGSGQGLFEGEATKFKDEIDARIDGPAITHHYELGSEMIEGHAYPALPVGSQDWDRALRSLGAAATGGGGFSYGASVDEGVEELHAYLKARASTCPDSLFVLGGYSQGAQVVGETYNEKLSDDLKRRVVYQALFGDPRLYLPEGQGLIPPACLGLPNKSEWRFDVPDCGTGTGSLGSRVPYLPVGFTSTTGLSCATHDFVCGASPYVWDQVGHGTYDEDGGSIYRASVEIAKRLKPLLPDAGVNDTVSLPGAGTAGLDVVFLIDSTGSMWGQIEATKAFAAEMADTIKVNRGRVALVEYKDAGDQFTARILSGFQEDTTEFNTQLTTIYASGGGDRPEATLHALMTAFNGLEWRNGATKAAVVLTDADYHDPDLVDGSTLASVAQRALEIDPVNVYPVVPSYFSSFYAALAQATTGQVIVNGGDTKAALTTALTRIQERPVAILRHPAYWGPVGQEFTFDASASYSPNSSIIRYDWDYNGDGTFEESGTTPVARHTYPAKWDGQMQVRMTDANGLIANASAAVHVGSGPRDALPAAPLNVKAVATSTAGGTSTVQVTWESSDPRVGIWGLSVDGIPAGAVDAAARTATITEVSRGKDVEIGVVGFTADHAMGTASTVTLPAVGSAYNFGGFMAPVDAAPALNVMTAGRAVPMQFSLGGDLGMDILAAGSPTSAPVTCDTGAALAEVETTSTAGSSSLSYDAAQGVYTYVWKTEKAWANSCRMFKLTLKDGSSHTALFKYRS
ncbi:PxKF domain-containing protein [Arthrobacter oryzae]|uniref:PxKF domain-containing protein n=1 Tax=Arthrobacter oryzae TaxID=409290 RepID=UPI00273ADF37|nr:PxKF domain-containing protein [Arthrobacter oryzae]WLQ06104.1 PxKF domain-containing protein [Arthrobacter oryzae]